MKRNEVALVPEVRFGEFGASGGWKHIKLSDCLEVIKVKNKLGKYSRDQVLSVAAEAGVVNQIKYHGRSYAGKSLLPYNVVLVGDLVYTKSPLKEYPYGIIKLNQTNDGVVSTLYAVYRPNPTCDGKFVDYYFYSNDKANRYLKPLVNIGAKNDMKVNNFTVLAGKVVFPTLPEQQKIAAFLGVVDGRLGVARRRVVRLEAWKSGVVKDVFSSFKNEHQELLGSLVDFKSGNTPSKQNDHYWGGDIPWISASAMRKKYLSNSNRKITESAKSAAKFAQPNEVLLLVRGSMLYNTIPMGITTKQVAFNQDVKRLVRKTKLLSSEYLYYILLAKRNYLLNKVVGTGIGAGKLATDLLENILIPFPSLPEQTRIATILTTVDARLAVAEREVALLEEWKRGLLQKMLV